MTEFTPNYGFPLPEFDKRFWHDEMNRILKGFDSILAKYVALGNVKGVWSNSTAYVVGDVLIDDVIGNLYECAVSHTSANTGTFADERATRTSYWINASITNRYRGTWTASTMYRAGDFVVSGNKYSVATQSFTSGATFADDEGDGYFETLIDLSAIPASAVPIANVSTALYYVRQNAAGDGYEVVSIATIAAALGLGALAALSTLNGSLIVDGTVSAAKLNFTPSSMVLGTPIVLNPYAGNQDASQAHGLAAGGYKSCFVEFECLATEGGHTVGEKLKLPEAQNNGSGVAIYQTAVDETSVKLWTHASSNPIIVGTDNATYTITQAKWKITVTPFRVG